MSVDERIEHVKLVFYKREYFEFYRIIKLKTNFGKKKVF